MRQAKTHRELYGVDPVGPYEWDAGNTPPHDWPGGRYTVKLTWEGWDVLYHPFPIGGQEGRPDEVLVTFPPGEDGERAAKSYALELVDRAWGRETAVDPPADDPGEHFMDGGRFGYDWGPYAEEGLEAER